MRTGFSNIAAMLSALLALAAVHQTYEQNALRINLIFPTASAPKPFKLAPGSRRSRADLRDLERGSIGDDGTGKIRLAEGSGGERCEMSPEEFAKFYPPLIDWIQNTLAASAPVAQAVASRGFSRLPLYLTQETLESTKVVMVDPLPIPPLSSMGLTRFADFERGHFDGITYLDTIFLKSTNLKTKECTFMSLFMSFNGGSSDQIAFYCYMRMVWNALAIVKVRWKQWHTIWKQRSPVLRPFLM